ncbi:NDP-sugar synthase [Nanoarchaeota archaeon]
MLPIKKAIILAGGKGTRLRPLTYKVPKALVPLQGRTLTDLALDIFKKFEVKEIVLSVCYLADQVREYFGDGSKFGFEISYVEEKTAMGTAGPLLLLPKLDETFIMINGDNLFNLDFEKMYELHKKNNATATIGLTQIPKEKVSAFGVAKLEGDRILEFVEKPEPKDAPSDWINSGYYILEPEVFDVVKGKDFAMVEKDLFPVLAKQGKLFGYKDEGQWFDTGTPERVERVKNEWKGPV